MPTELQTFRGRAFFWIGLATLPVFWLWWMSEHHFTRRQIGFARVWCLLYVVAVNAAWFLIPYFREQITELRWTYSMVAFWIGLGLWVWLFWRVIRPTIIEILIGGLAMPPMLISSVASALNLIAPHPLSLLFIVVPAGAHLLVESMPRNLRRKSSPDAH